jgi:methylsterol monooxygenase
MSSKAGSYSRFLTTRFKIWLFHPIAEGLGMSTWQVPFPVWQETVLQVAFFFVYEDMFHFFGTQTLLSFGNVEGSYPYLR